MGGLNTKQGAKEWRPKSKFWDDPYARYSRKPWSSGGSVWMGGKSYSPKKVRSLFRKYGIDLYKNPVWRRLKTPSGFHSFQKDGLEHVGLHFEAGAKVSNRDLVEFVGYKLYSTDKVEEFFQCLGSSLEEMPRFLTTFQNELALGLAKWRLLEGF